jgi:hypothetical protein
MTLAANVTSPRYSVLKIGILCAVLVYGCKLHAQDQSCPPTSAPGTIQNNPPIHAYMEESFLSEDVRNEDEGKLQVTFSSDSRQGLGGNLTFEVEYGLTKRLQFSSETPFGLTATSNSEVSLGWSKTSLGLQYQVIRSTSPFALTVGMSFGISARRGAVLEFEPEILVLPQLAGSATRQNK